MHDQMERLYAAAKALKGIEGQSAVGMLLNVSPQVMNNWEARGISKRGLIAAQEKIGCSAVWLETGVGDMAVNSSLLESWNKISATAQEFISFIASNVIAGTLSDKDIATLKGRAEQMTEHAPTPSTAPAATAGGGIKIFPEGMAQVKGVKHGKQ